MKLATVLGVGFALFLHAAFLLFGGLLLPAATVTGSRQEVELVGDEPVADKKPEPEPEPAPKPELDPEQEPPPDAETILKQLEAPPSQDAPALEAASLAAIEQALGNSAGAAGFAEALSFGSGGRIGGTGKPGTLAAGMEQAFSLNELDQKPRPIVEPAPMYPAELRGRKVDGQVTVVFQVDSSGRVVDPRIEKTSHPAFAKPALQAVRQWKFEPALKQGQRVACRIRRTIRFQPS